MRTNIFNFKKIKKNKIVLEEETTDGPFLIFLKKNKKLILLILGLLILLTIILTIYYAVISIKEGTKVVTNINNVVVDFDEDNTVSSINMKPISGGEANKEFYSRYGNIGLSEGVIFVIKEIDTKNGHLILFSDGSSMLIKSNGAIVRISSLPNGDFGIREEDGSIIVGAKTKEISITKTAILEDNTIVIYYSDNSCRVIISTRSDMLVRNSDRLVIKNNRLITIEPSGVSKELKAEEKSNYKITYYEDGTMKIEDGKNTYVVRNNEDINMNNMTYPFYNEATIIKTIDLKDGSKLIYYSDGLAEYINKDNVSIMVRKSKDIIYTDERVIEIVDTKYAHISSIRNTDDKKVTYLDNAGGLIENKDGTFEYVYENSEIKYDKDGDILDSIKTIKEINHKETPNGALIINLEDGNSIIKDDNGYRVVPTDKIVFDKDGNIKGITGEDDIKDDSKSISDNHFIIENKGNDDVKYLVTIEVSDNYKKYASILLNPIYLRYNMVVNSTYIENKKFDNLLPIGTILENNTKITKETYVLYTGTLESGKTADVTLGIWLDYTDITNEYQESVFVGTITIYSETINKE